MIKTLDDCVAAALSALPQTARERFAREPLNTLEQDLGLTVRPANHLAEARAGGGWCDGQSYFEDGVVLYRPTGNRRENFTLGHELGHWLVDQVDDIYDWLGAQDEGDRLHETICDAVAQTLLIPRDAVNTVLAGGHVSAGAVLRLADESLGSRPVCAIAMARRLPGTGAVVIVDRDQNTVSYSSVQPDPIEGWPSAIPWPGQDVPNGHPLSRVLEGEQFGAKSFWTTPWGTRQQFYVDAVGLRRVVIAVFADRDLWGVEAVHFDAPTEFVSRPKAEIRCCGGVQRARGYPCPDCGRLFCPECGGCLCTQRAANASECSDCGLTKTKHLIGANGVCVDCE